MTYAVQLTRRENGDVAEIDVGTATTRETAAWMAKEAARKDAAITGCQLRRGPLLVDAWVKRGAGSLRHIYEEKLR